VPPPQPYANVPFGSLVVPPDPAPTTAATTAAAPAKPAKPGKRAAAKAKDDDGYTVASAAVETPKATKKKADKLEPKKAEAKAAPKPEPKAAAQKASVPDDTARILKAAMGATENTL